MHDSQTQKNPVSHTLHFILVALAPQPSISHRGRLGMIARAVAGLALPFVLVIFFFGDDDIPFLFDRALACCR
jgi:hypothetical protein